jgi:hypothetical protein
VPSRLRSGYDPRRRIAIQLNDVFVDERGIVYAVDRFAGGLYVLDMPL